MIDFSVIVPAYNVENYIKKCIDSVLRQTYKNYEIIIVDDGSTDNTYEILKNEYTKENIKIIHKENGGLSSARNVGVESAKGRYIIFLDSDDWWEKDLLSNLRKTIDKFPVDIVCFKLQKYYENENTYSIVNIPSFSKSSGINALKKFIESNLTFETAVTFAYNLDFWKKNKFEYAKGLYHEDFGLTPYVIAKAKDVISIDYVGYNYYQRSNSITKDNSYNKTLKKTNDTLLHFKFLKDKFMKINLDSRMKDLIANYIMSAIIKKTIELRKTDQKKIYKKLREYKAYELFNNGSIKSYIKYILVKISPKQYKIFV